MKELEKRLINRKLIDDYLELEEDDEEELLYAPIKKKQRTPKLKQNYLYVAS